MASLDGTTGNDIIPGTGSADTIIGDAGNDTITAAGGNDLLFGDLVDPFDEPTATPPSGGIGDPSDEPARLSGSTDFNLSNSFYVESGGGKKGGSGDIEKIDLSDDNAGGQRDDFLITDGGTGDISGTIDFKFPGTGKGDDTADIARFDLSTFDDNFTIEVKSEDDSDADGDDDPFDIDGPPQDLIILQDANSVTDNGDGTVDVEYTGRDGGSYTMTIDFGGARILAYGPGGVSDPLTFDDSIAGGTGNDTIDGGLGNDDLDGDGGNDTFIASRGDDDVDGGTGTDRYDASGDIVEGLDFGGGASGTGIGDPADFPRLPGSTDFNLSNSFYVDTGKGGDVDKIDLNDANEEGQRDDFRITDGGTGDISGTIDFKFPGGGGGDDTADIARFDLSTFDDNFTIEVKSEDDSDADGDDDPFDIDGPPQDLIILEDVDTITDNGDGTVTVTYTGSDNGSYTMNIDFGGARVIGFDGSGDPVSDADIIEDINVTVGTTGVDNNNLAQYGDGTVVKDPATGPNGTDTITSVEDFVANENGQTDIITLTGPVRATDVNISDSAQGTFTDENGTINFGGGGGQPTLSDILSGPEGLRDGTWQITSGAESGEVGGITFANFETINFETICFVRGTLIDTAEGPKKIEEIAAGDLVRTQDHGLQPVRWIGASTVRGTGQNAPIQIRKGALGNDRDLWVSPQHRMLLSGWQLELLFAEPEALVPAKMLVNDQSILQTEVDQVEYFHMMFDTHEIVFAEGAPSESFHPGRMGMGTFSEETRAEIFRLFPQLETGLETYGPSARMTLKSHEARILVEGSDMFEAPEA